MSKLSYCTDKFSIIIIIFTERGKVCRTILHFQIRIGYSGKIKNLRIFKRIYFVDIFGNFRIAVIQGLTRSVKVWQGIRYIYIFKTAYVFFADRIGFSFLFHKFSQFLFYRVCIFFKIKLNYY